MDVDDEGPAPRAGVRAEDVCMGDGSGSRDEDVLMGGSGDWSGAMGGVVVEEPEAMPEPQLEEQVQPQDAPAAVSASVEGKCSMSI